MKRLLLLFSVVALVCCDSKSNTASFPTKAGEFHNGEWKYVYEIESLGSKSEKRIGHLYYRGELFKGKVGDLVDEPIGRFAYFGENNSWNQGWLNTRTYDKPVFGPASNLTSEMEKFFEKRRREM